MSLLNKPPVRQNRYSRTNCGREITTQTLMKQKVQKPRTRGSRGDEVF